jgi:serine/threonine protein phosphatase 1
MQRQLVSGIKAAQCANSRWPISLLSAAGRCRRAGICGIDRPAMVFKARAMRTTRKLPPSTDDPGMPVALPGRLPDGTRVYAIGDVHGHNDLLEALLERVREHVAANPIARPRIVFVGDYVDRGPASRQVLDTLLLSSSYQDTICLQGNHEGYVLDFLDNPASLSDWLRLGGLETLRSYGLNPGNFLDSRTQQLLAMSLSLALHQNGHLGFLRDLPSSFTCGDFFFVHAGVRPGVPLDQQSQRDLLEIRKDFLLCTSSFGKIVVHGHTPVSKVEIHPNRINIDTGAYATGRLTCVAIEGNQLQII